MRDVKLLTFLAALVISGCQAQTDSKSSAAGKTTPAVARATPRPPAPTVLPEGTVLPAKLETGLSSATSKEGDAILARLAEDVKVGDKVVLKEGTELRGHVVAAAPSGRVKGRAHLAIDFDRIVVNGKEREAELRAVDISAGSGKDKDAKLIGGGAGAGLIIGAIADGKKGALIGTAIGAAAGTGAALATKGKEVELPSGTTVHLKVEKETRL